MYKTRLTELFGIEYPIIQGGMMYVSTADLSAAAHAARYGLAHALPRHRQRACPARRLPDEVGVPHEPDGGLLRAAVQPRITA